VWKFSGDAQKSLVEGWIRPVSGRIETASAGIAVALSLASPMTRITTLLLVMLIAGAQASAFACELACAGAAAVSDPARACHVDSEDAAGLRVTPASAPCHHEAAGPWLTEVGQPVSTSVMAATGPTVDTAGTTAPPTESAYSLRWLLAESPPHLGLVRPSVLRI